jgi:hypothetical protein
MEYSGFGKARMRNIERRSTWTSLQAASAGRHLTPGARVPTLDP